MIEQFKELLLEANSGSEAFNSGINKANKKAVSALRRLLKKQSEEVVNDTHYFISYEGYENGKSVMYGSKLVHFSKKEEIEKIERDVALFAVDLAKEYNKSVNNVHIIAFNKV